MADVTTPRLGKLPFWLADTTLLIAAGLIMKLAGRPLGLLEIVGIALCVGVGGWLAVLPYLREHEAAVRLAETNRLVETIGKINRLDTLADRIAQATGHWQVVQDRAQQTAEMSRGIVERLTRETEALASTVSRAADAEKQTLKLEAEKLRRNEGEWLQAAARVMDHIFALHVAAVRSGQPALMAQIDRFHAACREAMRRVGFVPVVAAPDEKFDPRKHQVLDGAKPATEGARIHETVAPGFLFQGRLLRPVMVSLVEGDGGASPAQPPTEGQGASATMPNADQNAAGGTGSTQEEGVPAGGA